VFTVLDIFYADIHKLCSGKSPLHTSNVDSINNKWAEGLFKEYLEKPFKTFTKYSIACAVTNHVNKEPESQQCIYKSYEVRG
jgi:hypothetical protein